MTLRWIGRPAAAFVVFCGSFGVAPSASAHAPAVCEPKLLDTLALLPVNGEYLVETRINQYLVKLILDTGSQGTIVTQALADKLDLPIDHRRSTRMIAVSGRGDSAHNAIISDFQIGHLPSRRLSATVDSANLGMVPAFEGILGADILFNTDIAFDFPNRTVGFYDTAGCARSGPPAGERYLAVAAKRSEHTGRFLIPVQINGHSLWGILDTGATGTAISRGAALSAGIPESALDGGHVLASTDAFGKRTSNRKITFASVAIGPERFHNVAMPVADASFREGDLLIGQDYLRSRKVWLSPDTGRMFVMPSALQVPALRLSQAAEDAAK